MEGKGNYKLLLFYKYVRLTGIAQDWVGWHKVFCGMRDIKGRILIGDEGINGTLAGSPEMVDEYLAEMKKTPLFSDIDFKISFVAKDPFPKLKVKYRKEIVTLGLKKDIDMNDPHRPRGTYLTPEEVQKLVDSGEEFYFVDARNEYEAKIGKFKDAIVPDIEAFRDFPKFLKSLEPLKDKKLVFYCTGGIRCEKATAYAKQEGFKDVYHIQGGIQRYAEKFPKGAFEGSMYVFDDRVAVAFDNDPDRVILTNCEFCNKTCDTYQNCFNASCNRRMICCDECYKKNEGYCKESCKQEAITERKDKSKFEQKLSH
jgi:UPF0176 protein